MLLHSPLSLRSFAARLKGAIHDPLDPKKERLPSSWKTPVAGEVWGWPGDSIRFYLFKRRAILNVTAPHLEGRITSSTEGCTISARIDITHSLFNIILLPCAYLYAAAYILSDIFKGTLLTNPLLYAGIGIVYLAAYLIDGWFEIRYLRRFLEDFVNRTSEKVHREKIGSPDSDDPPTP